MFISLHASDCSRSYLHPKVWVLLPSCAQSVNMSLIRVNEARKVGNVSQLTIARGVYGSSKYFFSSGVKLTSRPAVACQT